LRDRVAPSPVGAFGVTEMGMRCLEVGHLAQSLITFLTDRTKARLERESNQVLQLRDRFRDLVGSKQEIFAISRPRA
jgi:hypothetical protein